jgi:hypothetical protein
VLPINGEEGGGGGGLEPCKEKAHIYKYTHAHSTYIKQCWNFGLCAGIFKQSMGTSNRVGIGLSYRPARLHRQAESIPWNRFLGSF